MFTLSHVNKETQAVQVVISEMCTSDACEAMNSSVTINVIKEPTFFMGLKCDDFSASTAIDYMHCVLLGVTKKLITFWFSVSFSSETFSSQALR